MTLHERDSLMRRNRGLLMTSEDASRLALWIVLTTLLAGAVIIWAMASP